MLDSGGEWLAIIGSAALTLEYGEAEWEVMCPDSTAGETNGMWKGAPRLDATGVESPAVVLNMDGLANSDGDVVVAADIGGPRGSIP